MDYEIEMSIDFRGGGIMAARPPIQEDKMNFFTSFSFTCMAFKFFIRCNAFLTYSTSYVTAFLTYFVRYKTWGIRMDSMERGCKHASVVMPDSPKGAVHGRVELTRKRIQQLTRYVHFLSFHQENACIWKFMRKTSPDIADHHDR